MNVLALTSAIVAARASTSLYVLVVVLVQQFFSNSHNFTLFLDFHVLQNFLRETAAAERRRRGCERSLG